MINPDPARWAEISELFDIFGARLFGRGWKGVETEVKRYGKTSVIKAPTTRIWRTEEEIRRFLYAHSVSCALLRASDGALQKFERSFWISDSLYIATKSNGYTDHIGKTEGRLLVDRAALDNALSPRPRGKTRDLRGWLTELVKDPSNRMKKQELFAKAAELGISKAATERMWHDVAPEHWKRPGRPRSR